MTLHLALAVGAEPGSVDLAVTGAAHPGTSAYASDFTAGVDSWSSDPGSNPVTPGVSGNIAVAGVKALRVGSAANPINDATQFGKRTVTGLTAGQVYRLTAKLRATAAGVPLGYVGVVGISNSDGQALTTSDWSQFSYDFTATATSHVIKVSRSSGVDSSNVYVYDVHVQLLASGAIDPIIIERSDDNGTVFVRLAVGQDVDSSGNLSVTDSEAAISAGGITYQVRDGLGNIALASTSLYQPDGQDPLLILAGESQPVDVERVTGYRESYLYAQTTVTVKARIGKGAPLTQSSEDYGWTKRQDTLTLYAGDYAAVRRLTDMFTAGRVALLRQDTHPGLDMYFVATAVRAAPGVFTAEPNVLTGEDGPRWTWSMDVDYIETGWPEGELIGSEDWTMAALAAAWLTMFDVAGHYVTFSDLAQDIRT